LLINKQSILLVNLIISYLDAVYFFELEMIEYKQQVSYIYKKSYKGVLQCISLGLNTISDYSSTKFTQSNAPLAIKA